MRQVANALCLQVYRLCPPPFQRRFWWLLAAMLLLALVETATVGLIAFYAAAVSDPLSTLRLAALQSLRTFPWLEAALATPRALIGSLSLLVMLAVPLKNLLRGLVTYRMARYSASLEALFGQRLLARLLARDYLWQVRQNSADLVQQVNWRHHLGRNFVTPHLNMLCELAMLTALLAGLLLVQPLVSLLFFAMQAAVGVLVYRGLRRGLDRSATACRQAELVMSRQASQAIHGVKDVQMTGSAAHFVAAFAAPARRFAAAFGRQQFWKESPLLALESLGFVLVAGAIVLMLFGLHYSPLQTTGTTALLAVTAWRSLPAFNRVLSSLAGVRGSRPYVLTLLDVLQAPLETAAPQTVEAPVPLGFERELALEAVSFAYDAASAPVLHDFNLRLRRGESLGVMGPSGCGKSTLIDVICGLLLPTAGTVRLDDRVLQPVDLPAWRCRIGYVPQFPYIFDGTLAQNVAFGEAEERIDHAAVLQACTQAGVDFLAQLPQGIDTAIGERGVRLSGGQRQRVAIARALYRQPQVVIFDEATSALDEEKDAQIRQLLLQLKGRLTLIVVSHRPSTLADCDRILRMG